MSTIMLVAFVIGLFSVVMLGIIGCIATIEEVDYRNELYKQQLRKDKIK